MGNPVKGEVTFDAGGQSYRLVFGANALAALEERLDMSVGQIGALFGENMRIGHIRVLMWAGLFGHHNVSESEAGSIMDLIGFETAGELIGKAFVLAFPQDGGDDDARPRKAAGKTAAGTGKPS